MTPKNLWQCPTVAAVLFTQECLTKGQKDFPLAQLKTKLQNIKPHLN